MYVSIDIETTGLNPETCQILEISAVIDNGTDNFSTFHCFVDNGLIQGEPAGLLMNTEILRIIAEKDKYPDTTFLKPEHIAYAFHDFLVDSKCIRPLTEDYGRDYSLKITVAGQNFTGFDLRFLRRLPRWEELIPIRHKVIDPGNLFWREEDGDKLPDLATCLDRIGCIDRVAHRAVDDAKAVVKLVKAYKALR